MFDTKVVSGLFDTYEKASATVGELEVAGYTHDEHITLVTNHPGAHEALRFGTEERTTDLVTEEKVEAEKAALGGLLGGGAVGLLASLGLVALPGVGFVVAGGWLVSTAIGAAFGGAGGLVAALVQCGHIDVHAQGYVEAVKNGGTLVVVRCKPSQVPEVEGIIGRRSSNTMPIEIQEAA